MNGHPLTLTVSEDSLRRNLAMIAFIDEHRDTYGVEPIGNIPPAEARYYEQLNSLPMVA